MIDARGVFGGETGQKQIRGRVVLQRVGRGSFDMQNNVITAGAGQVAGMRQGGVQCVERGVGDNMLHPGEVQYVIDHIC